MSPMRLLRRKRIIAVQDTPPSNSHYWMCHPEDDSAPDKPADYIPQGVEPCWHCGTKVDIGCYCLVCAYYTYLIPPGYVYHCKGCGRWWFYEYFRKGISLILSGRD